jgi:outer membrane protein OmpA-like peptidoglycan-associated protein
MKSLMAIHVPLVAALILVGGSAGISRATPVDTAANETLSDSRGGRTGSSPQENWDYQSLPTPSPSESPAQRLNEIAFEDNSTALNREGIAVCRQMAGQIKSMNAARILIVGFSHKMELDPALGQRRATAVRERLIREGLEPSRLESASFGSQFSEIANSPHPYFSTAAQGVEIWILER